MSPTYGSKYPALDEIRKAVEGQLPSVVVDAYEHRTEVTLVVKRESIHDLCVYLRDDDRWQFKLLADVTAADWPKREKRFDVLYNLYSPAKNLRLRIKLMVGEGESIPSVADVWSSANWAEREVYDMFGVPFDGHPDLRRILMPDDWEGYPQRKDFPLSYELPKFSHNLSERPEFLEQPLRWFGNKQYGSGRPQLSERQGPEGRPVAGWDEIVESDETDTEA